MDIYEIAKPFSELCKNPSQAINFFYIYSTKLYQEFQSKPGVSKLFETNHPALAGWAYLGFLLTEKFQIKRIKNLETKIEAKIGAKIEEIKFPLGKSGQDLLEYH